MSPGSPAAMQTFSSQHTHSTITVTHTHARTHTVVFTETEVFADIVCQSIPEHRELHDIT